jgi:hypothetical protein
LLFVNFINFSVSKTKGVKFPNANRPQFIYSNEDANVSITITLSAGSSVTESELPDFKNTMENFLTRMTPGIRWISKGYVTINNVRWVKLEMTSNAVDTTIRNIMLITSLNGKPLMLNFNSTENEYPYFKEALDESMNSLIIK